MNLYKTKSAKETQLIASQLAGSFINGTNKKRNVVALTGELGSGKTTFVKAFTRKLGVSRKITSPTFLILRRFAVKNKPFKSVFHIDAYRVRGKKDIHELSIEKILRDKSGIVLVEWAENIKSVLPRNVIWVKFKYGEKRNERKITIN